MAVLAGSCDPVTAVERKEVNQKYTFELFVCVAVLQHYRDDLLACKDIADIYTFINR